MEKWVVHVGFMVLLIVASIFLLNTAKQNISGPYLVSTLHCDSCKEFEAVLKKYGISYTSIPSMATGYVLLKEIPKNLPAKYPLLIGENYIIIGYDNNLTPAGCRSMKVIPVEENGKMLYCSFGDHIVIGNDYVLRLVKEGVWK